MDIIGAINAAHAQAYGRLDAKVTRHISDNIRHITKEEREAWNNKAEKQDIEDLKSLIADQTSGESTSTNNNYYNTIKEYVENGGYITAEWFRENTRNFITRDEFQFNDPQDLIDIDLSDYATKAWVEGKLPTYNPTTVTYQSSISSTDPNKYDIGTLTVNNTNYKIYGKNAANSGSGGDTSDLQSQLDAINNTIRDIQSTLGNIHNYTEEEIQNLVNDLMDQYDLITSNHEWGELFHNSGFVDELNSYVQQVGFLDEDNKRVTWSELLQSFNQIKSAVNSIQLLTDENGNVINYEALSSIINQSVEDHIADLEMYTSWEYLNENRDLIDWMISGFRSQAQDGSSFAQVYSSTKEAIAALETKVTNQEATVTAAAQLGDAVSGLQSKVSNLEAQSGLYAKLDGEGVAAIVAAVNESGSNVLLNADKINLNGDVNVTGNFTTGGDNPQTRAKIWSTPGPISGTTTAEISIIDDENPNTKLFLVQAHKGNNIDYASMRLQTPNYDAEQHTGSQLWVDISDYEQGTEHIQFNKFCSNGKLSAVHISLGENGVTGVRISEGDAYTSIFPGRISLVDSEGNTKEITAAN